jgi:hypothetical protein
MLVVAVLTHTIPGLTYLYVLTSDFKDDKKIDGLKRFFYGLEKEKKQVRLISEGACRGRANMG